MLLASTTLTLLVSGVALAYTPPPHLPRRISSARPHAGEHRWSSCTTRRLAVGEGNVEDAIRTLQTEQVDQLARVAAMETNLRLQDIEQVTVATVDERHVQLQVVSCEPSTGSCIALDALVEFPNLCSTGDDFEACVISNIRELADRFEEDASEDARQKKALQSVDDMFGWAGVCHDTLLWPTTTRRLDVAA